jgi:putative Holliday junction resolvase
VETGEPGPVLAIDLGLRRTGLARSDPGRVIAFGLPTFELRPGRSLKAHLVALHQQQPFTGVVLGLPFHADGRPGSLAGRIERLAAWIGDRFSIPVALQDERLTSVAAAELLEEAGGPRRDKKRVDQLAAQVILREFLAEGCPFPSTPRVAPATGVDPFPGPPAGDR